MVTIRPYRSADRPWIADTHVRFYQTVHNFDRGFADVVDAALALLERQKSEATSFYQIMEAEKQRVGCLFLSADAPAIGRVRLFYLDAAYRRRGLGKRLLRGALAAAKDNSLRAIRVSTFDRHPEACRLYEAFGFELVKTAPSQAFGQDLTQVDYELWFDRDDS